MITKRDDDYLICGEYQKHIQDVSADHPGFITFQHANGNHYFAWVDGENIILRSEAYPDADKMVRGINAILKNRDLAERYSVDEAHGVHFLVLWGGGNHQQHTGNMESHNEIGRSCPKKSRKEIHDLLLSKGAAFANAVVLLSDEDRGVTTATVAAATTVASTFASESKKEEAAPKTHATTTQVTTAHTTSHTSNSDNDGGGMGWLKWLLPLLLIAGLLYWWKGCKKGDVAADVAANAQATADSLANAAKAASTAVVTAAEEFGKKFNVTLTGAAENGIENKLIGFVNDSTKIVDKTTWFDFDRLLFDTGKATLQASSQEQLKNMAEILKAFPKVKLKIGGYTDNVGDDKANMKLSNDRANNVMAELVKLGIDKARLTAEGYGEQHPIGDNNTEEGRQQNRRISVRVTEK